MKLFVVVAFFAIVALENVSGKILPIDDSIGTGIMCPQYIIECPVGEERIVIPDGGCGIQQCVPIDTGIMCPQYIIQCPIGQQRVVIPDGGCGIQQCVPIRKGPIKPIKPIKPIICIYPEPAAVA